MVNFCAYVEFALWAHNIYDERPLDIVKYENLQRVFAHTAILRTLTRRFDENLAQTFDTIFSHWPIDEGLRVEIESLSKEDSGYWQTVPFTDLWEAIQTQLSGPPFSDVGKFRRICWKALGIEWIVEFENEYLNVCIAEELVSTLQIILADIATKDLVLLPTKVLITTNISDGSEVDIKEEPSNEISTWRVRFAKACIGNSDALHDVEKNVFALALKVLRDCSVLKLEDFRAKFDRIVSDGLPSKTFTIRPYSELFKIFLPESEFMSPNSTNLTTLFPGMKFELYENEQLAWVNKDGPGYSKERAREIIKNRYLNAIKPIRLTLPRLLLESDFKSFLCYLRSEGYSDWKILTLIANICVNYRVNKLTINKRNLDEFKKLCMKLICREEDDNDIEIPVSIFTKEGIDIHIKTQLAAIAVTWGLELHQPTPDFDALKKLLDVRYHNSEDDIEHDNFFGEFPANTSLNGTT